MNESDKLEQGAKNRYWLLQGIERPLVFYPTDAPAAARRRKNTLGKQE